MGTERTDPLKQLPASARYFPVRAGAYVMKAGLARLGTPFGNGASDERLLQLDRTWPRYRDNKLRARAESLDKYYCAVPDLDATVPRAVSGLLIDTLATDYPLHFQRERRADGAQVLHCALTGEALEFDAQLRLRNCQPPSAQSRLQPPYRDTLDALACQIQEDLAIVSTDPAGQGRVLLLHLCAPNHWGAADRIGKSFDDAHRPVPQFQRIARHAPRLLDNLRDAGPYVRFAWGLATDARLNHHPQPPADCEDRDAWHGRSFDVNDPQLWLRVERQALRGVPSARCFVFAIRTYFTDVRDLATQQRRVLADAVRQMDPEIARYKGLLGQQQAIAQWLEGLSADGGEAARGPQLS